MDQFGIIGAFRNVFERGLPMATGVTVEEHKALVHQLVTDPKYAGILNMEAVGAAGASWAGDI
jgi:hypothetical protein